MGSSKLKGLKPEWRIFCEAYIWDWSGTNAYRKAYPKVSEATARTNASRLLSNANIQAYIEEIQKDLFKLAGVSVLRNITELKNIAYSSLRNYQSNWMTLEEWEDVSDSDKAAISEITHTTTEFNGVKKSIVKFKLHPKQPALDSLNKMAGAAGVEKHDHTTKGESLNLDASSREQRIRELTEKARR